MDQNTVLKKIWLVSHELPEENRVAFFDENQSELVVVNALGGAVWDLLDGQRTVRDISKILTEEVEAAPALSDVESKVLLFLQQLSTRKAVEQVPVHG